MLTYNLFSHEAKHIIETELNIKKEKELKEIYDSLTPTEKVALEMVNYYPKLKLLNLKDGVNMIKSNPSYFILNLGKHSLTMC